MILQSENPIRMVCEFKGAKLSIIIVLGLVHQRVSQEWLERNTGYTDKTISQALAYLEEHGFTDHTNAGWQLTNESARQLVMPLELEEENPTEQEWADDSKIIDVDQTEDSNPSRNYSDSLTTTINNIDLIDSVVVDSNNNTKTRKNSDFEANLEEFKRLGIGRNKRTEALAMMEHVNPQYVCAHLKGLKKKDSKGLAIMRMEQGEDPPERSIEDMSDEEKRAKYAEWEQY